MQIVTDRGADVLPEQLNGFPVHYAPLRITLEGKTYVSGIDLDSETFYQMLNNTNSFPLTTQPSAGEFADLYRELAKTDPDILSIHISSGLSGTMNSARLGAEMVPEANITLWDSMTLSCPLGWQVEQAALMLQQGAKLDDILVHLDKLRKSVEGLYTLDDLKYLIHGGRISHIRGLMAAILKIKPLIHVEKELGRYEEVNKQITMKRAVNALVDQVGIWFGENTRVRIQPLHGYYPEQLEIMKEKLAARYDILWVKEMPIAPVLGAHTGATMLGMAVGPANLFE